MRLELTNPGLQKFVADKVNAGSYPSPEAVIEVALTQMMLAEAHELTEDDWRAIDEAEQEIDRGGYVELDAFASEMRKKYCGE